MNSFCRFIFISIIVVSSGGFVNAQTPEDIAFEKRFNELSEIGVKLNHHPALNGPWGSPHPDAPAELEQFAFMIGRHECDQPMQNINPNNPNQILNGKLVWLAFYALDGRAIRDEYYGMTSNGEQTRVYDPYAKEWWVTYATVPASVSLVPEPKPRRGSFTAIKNSKGELVMTSELVDKNGVSYVRTITFYEINKNGFEWKSENVYADKVVNISNMSCNKVAGPSS